MAHVNTVNPGDGHRGRDEFPRERDDYRGAHRRADEPEEYGDGYADDRYVDDRYADDRYYDTAYEDAEYVEAEPVEAELVDEEEERRGALGGSTVATGGAAGAAGAGAAGARDAAGADSRDAAAAGIPKRGLGMILLAVGVLLALWAVFALNKGDDSPSNTAEETQSSQASDAAQPSGADENGAINGADNGAAAPAPGQENAGQNGSTQNPDANTPDAQNPGANADANANGDADEAAPVAPAAPANNPATPGLTAQDAQVYVFNNSGVPELANKTAGELGGQYHVANQSQDPAAMNMPEQTFGVFPETYVFYNPQVAGADQVAADVAQRVGGTPRANNDLPDAETQLPSEAIQNRNAITVVLAGR